MSTEVIARVSMWIDCAPGRVFDAFVRPDALVNFWLSSADAPLEIGRKVHWSFLVQGAEMDTVATQLECPHRIEWDWSDGSHVGIDLGPTDGGTAVTIVNDRLAADGGDQVAAALNATEGFAIVLADLKTWIESGVSAGITRGKAKLIELRK